MDIESITNKIINADCMDILKQLPDKCIDLVVTSPPYDNLRTYNGTLEWSFEIFQEIAKELARILRDGGVIVWIVADAKINNSKTLTSFRQAIFFKEIGLNIHDIMYWEKSTFNAPKPNVYHNVIEQMFIIAKQIPKTFNPIIDRRNKCENIFVKPTQRYADGHTEKRTGKKINKYGKRFNIWKINEEKQSHKFGHPAMFPLQLAQDHIISWSNENDLILDCFSGSGTTAIACHNLKRRFICIEKDYDYWKASVERLENAQAQLKLF